MHGRDACAHAADGNASAISKRVRRSPRLDSASSPAQKLAHQTVLIDFTSLIRLTTIMSVTIPTTHTPPWVLLALALHQDIPVTWDAESGEKGQVEYKGIKGIEAVRAELEKGISGKEVSCGRLVIFHSIWAVRSRRCEGR